VPDEETSLQTASANHEILFTIGVNTGALSIFGRVWRASMCNGLSEGRLCQRPSCIGDDGSRCQFSTGGEFRSPRSSGKRLPVSASRCRRAPGAGACALQAVPVFFDPGQPLA